jgi:toxin ParE1/3/4
MRAVRWSTRARKSLADIFDYFEHRDEPEVAHRLTARIVAAGDALGQHSTGRPGWVAGTYLKSLTDIRYILVYRIDRHADGERIVILDVVHAMRDRVPGNQPPKPRRR